MSHLMIYCG